MSTNSEDIAVMLVQAIKAQGLSRKDIASRLGVSQPATSMALQPTRSWTINTLQKWCDAINADLEIKIVPRITQNKENQNET